MGQPTAEPAGASRQSKAQSQPQDTQDAQAKAEQERAEKRANAPQDTSAIAPGQFAGDPANQEGVRPATGTPPQVVEAGPGVELDTDLDPSVARKLRAGAVDETEGDDLLAAAQLKAPNLTAAFVEQYGLADEDLKAIARGEVPPPPTVGPIHSTDLYLTPGGWQQTPVGVPTEDVGKNAISR